MNNMKDKNVLIVGMGKSGIAAMQAMVNLEANVSVQDSKEEKDINPQLAAFLKGKNVTCYFGKQPEDMAQFDMLILSPGVPPYLPFIEEARKNGAEITGELEIAYRLGHGNYVAITGTNGKTTTTTLTGEIFKAAKRKTYVVGNIGVAVIGAAITASDDTWLVTEVSSFQLETTRDFRPRVSAILNLTPDHLNRHKTMEEYGRVKAKIMENQSEEEYVVMNYDDKLSFDLAKDAKAKIVPFSRLEQLDFGAFVKDGRIVIADEAGTIHDICAVSELQIPGSHNVENVLAAAAVSFFAGISADVIGETARTFMGVEHRLEYAGQVNGVRFVNDSKGTNPDSSIKAVEAIDGGIILIAGGYDKGSDFTEFIEAFNGKVKHMMLLGVTAPKIKEQAEALGFTNCVMCKDMDECVEKAYAAAEAGDTVLLSPACASWDMYSCFEQRGEHFKNCAHKLGANA